MKEKGDPLKLWSQMISSGSLLHLKDDLWKVDKKLEVDFFEILRNYISKL